MLISELLKCALDVDAHQSTRRVVHGLSVVPDREFQWALHAGFGPLLYHFSKPYSDSLTAARRDALYGADLSSRVLYSTRLQVAAEVVAHADQGSIPVVLLKGISTATQLYPAGHMRRMTDIDILVPKECYEMLESGLLANGFRRGVGEFPSFMNHGVPLYHKELGVRLEIHRRLFPLTSDFNDCALFDPATLIANAVITPFVGSRALRLPSEHELIYAASVLFRDLSVDGIHPTFLPTLFDVAYLARRVETGNGWHDVSACIDNPYVGAATFSLLTFLTSLGIEGVPDSSSIGARQGLVGPLGLLAIHHMLARCLLGAREHWLLSAPIPVPGRYNLRRQVTKRFRRFGKRE